MSFIKNKTLGLFVKTNGRISRHLYAGKGLIITLHRVRPQNEMSVLKQNKMWEITPEHLEKAIQFFKNRKYSFIASSEVVKYLSGNEKQKFVCFTIDDGYMDNIQYAYPVFRKYNIPFTIYLSTAFVTQALYPWEFCLEHFILSRNNFSFKYDNKDYKYTCNSEYEKTTVYDDVYKILKKNNHLKSREKTLNAVFGSYLESGNYRKIKMIDNNTVKFYANDAYLSFQNHTHNHYVLSQLTFEQQVSEITEASRIIEELSGKKTSEVAFPFGGPHDINGDSFKAAKKAGIKCCFIAYPGNVFAGISNFLIPRFSLETRTNELELSYMADGIRHFSYHGFSKTKCFEKLYSK